MYHVKQEKWGIVSGILFALFGTCFYVCLFLYEFFDPFPNLSLSRNYYHQRPMGDFVFYKPTEALPIEKDFWNYALCYERVTKIGNRCNFDGIDDFLYVSPKKIKGEKFPITIKLNLIEGESVFGIGNVRVKITKNKYEVIKYGKVIKASALENFSELELAFYKNGLISYVEVSIPNANFTEQVDVIYDRKTNITVELKNNFKGTIGPWIW